jgi:hypothetical protein
MWLSVRLRSVPVVRNQLPAPAAKVSERGAFTIFFDPVDICHAWFLVVTATNSWETRHIEAGTFLTPFDFAHFAIFVLDVNHVCYPVVTATNSCESTRHVEAGTFLALFDFAHFAIFVFDVNHACFPVVTATNSCESTRHV